MIGFLLIADGLAWTAGLWQTFYLGGGRFETDISKLYGAFLLFTKSHKIQLKQQSILHSVDLHGIPEYTFEQ